VGATVLDERHRNGAVFYAYFGDHDWTGTEFHLVDGAMAGVFPTHGGEANVWICGPATALADVRGPEERRAGRFLDLIDACSPSLAERLRASTRTSAVRGVVGMPNRVHQPSGPGWALVGDAGYFRDAVTGHGITDAFRDAELLARALSPALYGDVDEPSALRRYDTERHRMISDLFRITVRLAEYPSLAEFVELQRELSARIEIEAEELAAWPTLGRPLVAA
jgi:flavin-dependent dehydrogenase